MDKKIFAGKQPYLPAQIQKNKDRWQIVYYQTDPATGIRKRHRETWELNLIKDEKEREAAAKRTVQRLNKHLLPAGYPYKSIAEIERRQTALTLEKAVRLAMEIRNQHDNYETRKDTNSIGGVLLGWAAKNRLANMPVADFSRRHALDYLDYVGSRKNTKTGHRVSARTWNNYKNKTATLFEYLVDREHIEANPFRKIRRKATAPKNRRRFTPHERAAIAQWLYEHNYFAFLATCLQYYGFVRGTELRRLRANAFNLATGVITIEAADTKTNRARYVNMPAHLRSVLQDERFTSIPGNYFVFGPKGKPNPTKTWGRPYLWRCMLDGLLDLQRQGTIKDITGLSPYGMKDTGISELLDGDLAPIIDVMVQAGHTTPATTMIYFQPDKVRPNIQALRVNILDVNLDPAPPVISTDQDND